MFLEKARLGRSWRERGLCVPAEREGSQDGMVPGRGQMSQGWTARTASTGGVAKGMAGVSDRGVLALGKDANLMGRAPQDDMWLGGGWVLRWGWAAETTQVKPEMAGGGATRRF